MYFKVLLVVLFLACSSSGQQNFNRVLLWNDVLLKTYSQTSAFFWVGFEHHLVMHQAIYDALSDLGCKHANSHQCTEQLANLTVSYAAQYSLKALYPDRWLIYEDLLRSHIASEPSQTIRTKAKKVGEKWAKKAVEKILNRGGAAFEDYSFASGVEGRYQPTPPFFRPPVLQQYAVADTVILPSADFFVAPPIPAITSQTWQDDLQEVRVLGDVNSTVRTAYQTGVAKYMDGVQFGGNPEGVIGTYTRTAQEIILQTGKGLFDSSVIMYLISVSSFDVFLSVMYNKKEVYDAWRPITPIRNGVPSVPSIIPDPSWTPLLFYNSNQEYPAGHGAISACGDVVLKRAFGQEVFTWTLQTNNPTIPPLTFHNFTELKITGSEARIWAGIHFRFSLNGAWTLADQVCGFIYDEICSNNSCFRH
jgi:hypothetical protein